MRLFFGTALGNGHWVSWARDGRVDVMVVRAGGVHSVVRAGNGYRRGLALLGTEQVLAQGYG